VTENVLVSLKREMTATGPFVTMDEVTKINDPAYRVPESARRWDVHVAVFLYTDNESAIADFSDNGEKRAITFTERRELFADKMHKLAEYLRTDAWLKAAMDVETRTTNAHIILTEVQGRVVDDFVRVYVGYRMKFEAIPNAG